MSSDKQTFILKEKQVFQGEIFEFAINEQEYDLKDKIEFRFCTFKQPITFDKIKVKDGFSFYNCNFSDYSIIKNSSASTFTFISCHFDNDFILSSNKSKQLKFEHFEGKKLSLNGEHLLTDFDSLILDELEIKNININATNSESKIEFNQFNEIKKLNINSILVFSELIFRMGTFMEVYLTGNFKRSIKFNDGIKIGNLFFESCILNQRLDFYGGNFEHVYFQRSSFFSLIVINAYNYLEKKWKPLNIKNITLHSNECKQNISITLLKMKSIDISNNIFHQIFRYDSVLRDMNQEDYVRLSLNGTNQGNLTISNIWADLSISGINFGNVIFKEMNITHLYINELKNNGKISFSNIINVKYCAIQNTTIGSTEFLNVDLNKSSEVVIANSNIKGLDLSHYPKKVLSYSSNPKIGYGLKDKTKNNSNLRSVYNQLKGTAKTKGDVDTSVKYQSLEYKYLFREKNLGFDKILLLLNGLSNRYGKSWFRGVLFTLSVGFIAYWLYIHIIGFQLDLNSWQDYIKFISSYPKLYLEKYEEYNSLWSISLTIWLSRIFVSYGIYQTISAFRKYGKA